MAHVTTTTLYHIPLSKHFALQRLHCTFIPLTGSPFPFLVREAKDQVLWRMQVKGGLIMKVIKRDMKFWGQKEKKREEARRMDLTGRECGRGMKGRKNNIHEWNSKVS